MAVTLTGTGGLFTRLGKLIGHDDEIDANQTEVVARVDTVQDEYNNDRDLAFIFEQNLPGFISSIGTPQSTIQGVISNTIIEMVDDDDPLPTKDIVSALDRLKEQMVSSDDDIDETTVSSAIDVTGLVTGTGKMVVRLIDGLGENTQNVRAEDILGDCTTDAQESGTAGRETFSIKGEASVQNFDQNWPAGSGINDNLVATDPAVNASTSVSQNRATNSDFEDFTTVNIPDNWQNEVGTAGTDYKETSTAHRGSKALEFVGDSSTLSALSQQITIKPNTVYCIGVWVRDDGTGPAAGVLRASLRDSGHNIYNASTSLTTASVSIDLTAVGSAYAFSLITFEIPTLLPAGGTTAELWLDLTTALTTGRSAFVDGMFIAEMRQFGGLGGPFILITPGDTDFIRGDRFKAAITNNNEGQFVRGLDRFLGMYSLGKYIRSIDDGSETISDALVT